MYDLFKRIFDLLSAIAISLLAAPVALAVAFLLWLLQRSILFRQVRAGLHGAPFMLYKFCTMHNATDARGELLPDKERITQLGFFIRSFSIDELPQLWNVMRGEMSLVGPRPLLVDYLPLYTTRQARRHDVRPGITGWAQVNGRNALSWDEKFALDVWYVEHRNFWLDLEILWRTLLRVLDRSGIASPGQATMERFTGSSDRDS
jgi:sugar transferase EpsL